MHNISIIVYFRVFREYRVLELALVVSAIDAESTFHHGCVLEKTSFLRAFTIKFAKWFLGCLHQLLMFVCTLLVSALFSILTHLLTLLWVQVSATFLSTVDSKIAIFSRTFLLSRFLSCLLELEILFGRDFT